MCLQKDISHFPVPTRDLRAGSDTGKMISSGSRGWSSRWKAMVWKDPQESGLNPDGSHCPWIFISPPW